MKNFSYIEFRGSWHWGNAKSNIRYSRNIIATGERIKSNTWRECETLSAGGVYTGGDGYKRAS
jgi:hypothetical protein